MSSSKYHTVDYSYVTIVPSRNKNQKKRRVRQLQDVVYGRLRLRVAGKDVTRRRECDVRVQR